MAISTVDDIVSGLSGCQSVDYLKVLNAAKAAGAFQSSWLAAGNPGTGSAAPAYTAGSGYTCSSATAGAMRYTNASVQNWLARLAATCTQPGTLICYDRLWSCSGMGFAAATYTVTTPGSLPARITDNGVDVEAWIEQFVAAGAASGTLTLNYLNTNTGAAKAGVVAAVVSAPVAGQLQPIPIVAGDTGVRSIVSAVNSATWTSGSFGITLMKPVARIMCPNIGIGQVLDWAGTGLAKLPADACLMWAYLAQNTTAATLVGTMDIIDK